METAAALVEPVGPAARAKVGRPRSEESHQAILEAAVELMTEAGYGGMTMEGVAARAKVGKATVYRRWRSKAELLVEALAAHTCMTLPLVDTGDVRADLLVILEGMRDSMAGPDGPVMIAFAVEKLRYPELREAFETAFVNERRAHVRRIISEAVERGDLAPDTDVEVVSDLGPALLWHQVTMRGVVPPPDLPRRIIDQILPAPAGAVRGRSARSR